MAEASSSTPDDREDIQKKTFGKWINSQLPESAVTDLYFDLRDGHVLLSILEVLTGSTLRREKGSLRVHRLSNTATVISVLRENRVKLVNINNVDIVDGSPKITLALVWAIILHWQFKNVMPSKVSNLERALLAWARQATAEYPDIPDPIDFTSSWSDGLVFNAVLHRFRPSLFDLEQIKAKTATARLEFAFRMVQQHLGVAQLLDPEDVYRTPDKKSIMTYVMCLFQVLPHDDIDMENLQDLSIASDPGLKTESLIGSPMKSPFKSQGRT